MKKQNISFRDPGDENDEEETAGTSTPPETTIEGSGEPVDE